jgi:hypothetical protein
MLMTGIDEKQLRDNLIDKIKQLDKDRLLEIYQIVARSFANDLIEMVAESENSGNVDNTPIDRPNQDHRTRNPYR